MDGMVYVVVTTAGHLILVFLLLGTALLGCLALSWWVAPFYRVLANKLGVEVTGFLKTNRDPWIPPFPLAQDPGHQPRWRRGRLCQSGFLND